MIDVVRAFRVATHVVEREHPHLADHDLLPSRLACAAAAVLGSDGAGISLSTQDGFRVPLGASDQIAAAAERLKFTTGEGPCLEADEHREPVMATGAVLTRTWPVFTERLREQTPFRSIYAGPIPHIGTMDVYYTDSDGCRLIAVGDALLIAEQISRFLTDPHRYPLRGDGTDLAHPAGSSRHQVNIAMGLITQTTGVTFPDALAALRAHAFLTDSTVDDLAADIITGTKPITDLMP